MLGNIYYFKKISKIGGIEQFFYELARKYNKYSLTFYYDEADPNQLDRLKKYVSCKKRVAGQKVQCKKAFFNFNLDMINDVDAEEYVLVVHGNYKMLDGQPPQHPKITRVIAVSKDSAKAYTELTGIKCDYCYNPLTIEPVNKVIRMVSACRLEDKVKGGKRLQELITKMDQYCADHNRQYLLTIFTNSVNEKITSPNVAIMQPRIDIRPFLNDADYVIQLSDNFEGYCYTVNEALMYNTHCVLTPCNVYKELGINDDMSLWLDFDLTNIDKIVKDIFEKDMKTTKYEPPKDGWDKQLDHSENEYKPSATSTYVVRALEPFTRVLDMTVGRCRDEGEIFTISNKRYLELANYPIDIIEIVEEIKEEEKPVKKKSTKK